VADLFTRDGARRRVEPMNRRLRAAVTERVGLKVTAIFFASLLWFMLSAEEPTEELRTVRLSLVTDTLVELTSPLPTVRALVAGPRRELLRLDANPPVVRRVIDPNVAQNDTLEIRAADVDVGAADVRVRDVQPRQIVLQFRVSAERTVPIASRVSATPDTGITLLGPPRIEPASVRLFGARDRVNAIDSIYTVPVDLLVRDTLEQRVALDTVGLGVTVEPAHIRVVVPAGRLSVPDTLPATPAPAAATPPPVAVPDTVP
jgi:YbbR domain-containing protein